MSNIQLPLVISLVFFALFFVLLIYFTFKLLAPFKITDSTTILFREKLTSGWANDSIITKAGGAHGVLDIVITESELWLKTNFFLAPIAFAYKILNCIKLEQIERVEQISKKKVNVYFKTVNNKSRSVTLKMVNSAEFIRILERKINP